MTKRVGSGQEPRQLGQNIEGPLWLQGRLWWLSTRTRRRAGHWVLSKTLAHKCEQSLAGRVVNRRLPGAWPWGHLFPNRPMLHFNPAHGIVTRVSSCQDRTCGPCRRGDQAVRLRQRGPVGRELASPAWQPSARPIGTMRRPSNSCSAAAAAGARSPRVISSTLTGEVQGVSPWASSEMTRSTAGLPRRKSTSTVVSRSPSIVLSNSPWIAVALPPHPRGRVIVPVVFAVAKYAVGLAEGTRATAPVDSSQNRLSNKRAAAPRAGNGVDLGYDRIVEFNVHSHVYPFSTN